MVGTPSVLPVVGYEERSRNVHNATFLFHQSCWTEVGGGKWNERRGDASTFPIGEDSPLPFSTATVIPA